MQQSTQLEAVFSKKVLQRWHLVNIFLLGSSFIVPMVYEAPEADGLLEGSNNLLTFIASYGLFTLASIPGIPLMFPEEGLLQALLSYSSVLFINTGSISLLVYTVLKSILCFKRWQWRFQLRFWLLGLSCLWATVFGWLAWNNSFLLWGFKLLVCALVSAVLWEGINYRLYRRKT
ncbi:hypothetical protein [Stenomitos frigidus]|uniref:Uncharacterized protein n=1 Tax=Stenomitos frigidus ULC18 TaxID=2107698 RepID=A0A2T1DY46_9CYAN|nr:hypothetical protein [Stenomitos frigidus]PSB25304.1 hypothetical protein C7B82_23475 [Stenomitos frigidus ULC18]